MVTQRIVIIYALKFLCVVVKEHSRIFRLELFRPRPLSPGKVMSKSGGRDWIRTSDPALIKRML